MRKLVLDNNKKNEDWIKLKKTKASEITIFEVLKHKRKNKKEPA